MVRLFVAISYNRGVIQCTQYEKLDGEYFANFVNENFHGMFIRAQKGNSKLWIQDGDPSQNCAAVKRVLQLIGAKLLSIPARSPDINPIENFFHLVKRELRKDALERNITSESYNEFSERVINTITTFPFQRIDNIIESMDKRMDLMFV